MLCLLILISDPKVRPSIYPNKVSHELGCDYSTSRKNPLFLLTVGDTLTVSSLQILNDKPRLIKRTQLKRSSYRVLGKADKEQSTETETEVC